LSIFNIILNSNVYLSLLYKTYTFCNKN
jgi:hypothetical protein